jgi:hypothetical protein
MNKFIPCQSTMVMSYDYEDVGSICELPKGHTGKHQQTIKYHGGRECIMKWLNRSMVE